MNGLRTGSILNIFKTNSFVADSVKECERRCLQGFVICSDIKMKLPSTEMGENIRVGLKQIWGNCFRNAVYGHRYYRWQVSSRIWV